MRWLQQLVPCLAAMPHYTVESHWSTLLFSDTIHGRVVDIFSGDGGGTTW
jgi:hypothetical protein